MRDDLPETDGLRGVVRPHAMLRRHLPLAGSLLLGLGALLLLRMLAGKEALLGMAFGPG